MDPGQVPWFRFAPDGRRIYFVTHRKAPDGAVSDPGTIGFWDTDGHSPPTILDRGHAQLGLDFLPDGGLVTAGLDGVAHIWRPSRCSREHGHWTRRAATPTHSTSTASCSPTGRTTPGCGSSAAGCSSRWAAAPRPTPTTPRRPGWRRTTPSSSWIPPAGGSPGRIRPTPRPPRRSSPTRRPTPRVRRRRAGASPAAGSGSPPAGRDSSTSGPSTPAITSRPTRSRSSTRRRHATSSSWPGSTILDRSGSTAAWSSTRVLRPVPSAGGTWSRCGRVATRSSPGWPTSGDSTASTCGSATRPLTTPAPTPSSSDGARPSRTTSRPSPGTRAPATLGCTATAGWRWRRPASRARPPRPCSTPMSWPPPARSSATWRPPRIWRPATWRPSAGRRSRCWRSSASRRTPVRSMPSPRPSPWPPMS